MEADNSAELCQEMERVWNMSEKERINIGRMAQQRIASLSPETACHKLEEYFQKFTKVQ